MKIGIVLRRALQAGTDGVVEVDLYNIQLA